MPANIRRLIIENQLLDNARTVTALHAVFEQRATHALPASLPSPPSF